MRHRDTRDERFSVVDEILQPTSTTGQIGIDFAADWLSDNMK